MPAGSFVDGHRPLGDVEESLGGNHGIPPNLAGQVVHLLKHKRFRRFADEFRLPLVL